KHTGATETRFRIQQKKVRAAGEVTREPPCSSASTPLALRNRQDYSIRPIPTGLSFSAGAAGPEARTKTIGESCDGASESSSHGMRWNEAVATKLAADLRSRQNCRVGRDRCA